MYVVCLLSLRHKIPLRKKEWISNHINWNNAQTKGIWSTQAKWSNQIHRDKQPFALTDPCRHRVNMDTPQAGTQTHNLLSVTLLHYCKDLATLYRVCGNISPLSSGSLLALNCLTCRRRIWPGSCPRCRWCRWQEWRSRWCSGRGQAHPLWGKGVEPRAPSPPRGWHTNIKKNS